MENYIKWFEELSINDVPLVGGKNASLGEMYRELSSKGVNVPNGFAVTANGYRLLLKENGVEEKITSILGELDRKSFSNLTSIAEKIRAIVGKCQLPEVLETQIKEAFAQLKKQYNAEIEVAVRSSATAEDLPTASFAGQHDSYLNVKTEEGLLDICMRCYQSLFTARAIKYREENKFEHMQVALSLGVQTMVRSDLSSSGVGFTLDPETGFKDVILITAAWGLGENVVQGAVTPDEYFISKKALKEDKLSLIGKTMGEKEKTMVYAENAKGGQRGVSDTILNIDTPAEKRKQYALSDEEIMTVAKWAQIIEDHYGRFMDFEWAKDGKTGELFIVQARPETVFSNKMNDVVIKQYEVKKSGNVIVKGTSVGERIAAGKARILESPKDADKLQEGEILVTDITNPDWDPILKKAAAIVTNKGGRTSHAAIVAREMGAVAIVGAAGATDKIKDGQEVTVSCAEGKVGIVYEGKVDWEESEMDLSALRNPDTEVKLILADPDKAFEYAQYPSDGVGLMRLEFVINNAISIHPMALVNFDKLEDKSAKQKIAQLTHHFEDKKKFFVEKLSQAVGTIAAAFYPRSVIVRMSDFKSNEYANLIGGSAFEPEEENPMIGFRGASRYYSDRYKAGFQLECEAMKVVRDDMGFDNVKLMIPFCRTIDEGKKVLEVMEEFGLTRGENGLEIHVMAELPSNVMLAEEFAEIFDGFSIGSNDLTQLTLGIDRDSNLVSDLFNEQDPATKKMIAMVIQKARTAGKEIGLCGQAPSDFPEVAQFLVNEGINSISFNPDALAKGIKNILEAESKKEKQAETSI